MEELAGFKVGSDGRDYRCLKKASEVQVMSQMLKLVAAIVLGAGVIGAAGLARADEWVDREYYDDDFGDGDFGGAYERYVVTPPPPPPPPPVVIYREVPVAVPEFAPPVYGWVDMRPPSCGEYRYWDGDECLDARDDPPYVGPRW